MSSEKVPMSEMYPIMLEILEKSGNVTFTVTGWSMQPMLYNRRDTVTLVKPSFPLKKGDIPFFRRDDGTFVLHRIIKVNKDGNYTCRGDNQWWNEYPVRPDMIVGLVDSFVRNGKEYSVKKSFGYRLYVKTWSFFHHFKPFYKYFFPEIN